MVMLLRYIESIHMSFNLLHIFVLDEDFTVDCSRVREFGTLLHICLMDFSRSDFAIPIFIFFITVVQTSPLLSSV